MDYQANKEHLNDPVKNVPSPVKKIAEKLIIEGKSCEETAKLVSLRKSTVVSIRQQMEADGKLELGSWKREVAGLLGEFVQKGATRLLDNVENIPVGQLPMALAIAIDKVRDLADAPTVRIETRLRITQDELNSAFAVDGKEKHGKVIDVPNNQDEPTAPQRPSQSDEGKRRTSRANLGFENPIGSDGQDVADRPDALGQDDQGGGQDQIGT